MNCYVFDAPRKDERCLHSSGRLVVFVIANPEGVKQSFPADKIATVLSRLAMTGVQLRLPRRYRGSQGRAARPVC